MRRLLFSLAAAVCVVCCSQDIGGGFGSVKPDGSGCSVASDCASNNCSSAGACLPPAAGLIEIDGDCSGGGACVGDATCTDGLCVQTSQSPACGTQFAQCSSASPCCTGLPCNGGVCGGDTGTGGSTGSSSSGGTGGMPACANFGDTCNVDSDCCSGSCDPINGCQ